MPGGRGRTMNRPPLPPGEGWGEGCLAFPSSWDTTRNRATQKKVCPIFGGVDITLGVGISSSVERGRFCHQLAAGIDLDRSFPDQGSSETKRFVRLFLSHRRRLYGFNCEGMTFFVEW